MVVEATVAVAFLLAFCVFLSVMIHRERRRYEVDEFDGGFSYDNKPRAITKIKSTFIKEEKK